MFFWLTIHYKTYHDLFPLPEADLLDPPFGGNTHLRRWLRKICISRRTNIIKQQKAIWWVNKMSSRVCKSWINTYFITFFEVVVLANMLDSKISEDTSKHSLCNSTCFKGHQYLDSKKNNLLLLNSGSLLK